MFNCFANMCLETFDKEIDNVLFKSYEKRISSFKQWNGKLKPEVLARSGFYYLSTKDVCKCFYCGAEIYNWTNDDCPIEEHYRLSKNCDLIECLRFSEKKKCENTITVMTDMTVVIFFILLNIIVSIMCHFI